MQKGKSGSQDEKKSVKDLAVLGRFSGSHSNYLQVMRFIFIGLIFGMVGNGMWDILKPAFGSGNYMAEFAAQSASVWLMGWAMASAVLLMIFPFGMLRDCLGWAWGKWVVPKFRKLWRRQWQ